MLAQRLHSKRTGNGERLVFERSRPVALEAQQCRFTHIFKEAPVPLDEELAESGTARAPRRESTAQVCCRL